MLRTTKQLYSNKKNTRDIITDIEHNLSSLASTATSNAFKSAMERGESVLIAEKQSLYKCFPDGSRVFVENIVNKNSSLKRSPNKFIFQLKFK